MSKNRIWKPKASVLSPQSQDLRTEVKLALSGFNVDVDYAGSVMRSILVRREASSEVSFWDSGMQMGTRGLKILGHKADVPG